MGPAGKDNRRPKARPQRDAVRAQARRRARIADRLGRATVVVVVAGWAASAIEAHALRARTPATEASAPGPVKQLTAGIADPRMTNTAYLDEASLAFLEPVRGESGKLRAAFRVPGESLAPSSNEDEGAFAGYETSGGGAVPSEGMAAPSDPGIYKIAVAVDKAKAAVDDFHLVTLVPFAKKQQDRVGLYYIGRWPYEGGGTPRSKAYANPVGFIEVTRENQDTLVSDHFRLRDFLTKDQPNVWPKYLVLDSKLVDKLELIVDELEAQGHDVRHVQVMSGFRTPRYNHGGGNTAGRANLSRHMYGDASDVFVDNDRNGVMDDLDKDGRSDVDDAEVMARAAEKVEREHPSLVGGIGIYKACCGHGPFTHVDVRGYRARWRGEGTG